MSRLRPGSIEEHHDGFGNVRVTEASTCCHCQKITTIPNRRTMMDHVEICRNCMGLICLECYGKPCRPIMKRIEESEEREYRKQQYRKMLGL